MSDSRTPQESGSFGASFLAFALSKQDERPGGDVASPESGATNPEEEAPDTPRPGSSSGQQRRLSQREREPESTPRAGDALEQYEGLPLRFPTPPAVPRTTPPTFHRGPATSSSLSGSESLGIAASDPDPAGTMLARGPPPGARDPMDIPDDPAAGEVLVDEAERARYMDSAARHAAMVYRRLIQADSHIHAENLNREFERAFGVAYQNAFMEVVADPASSADESNGDERRGADDGETEGEDLSRQS